MSKSNTSLKSRATAKAAIVDRIQIINDSFGSPAFAVVPWSDFQALQAGGDETAALIAAGEAARGDETFPADVAKRLVAGEVPLKVIREWRGLTQSQLFEKSGVSEQYISQIERRAGGRNLGRKAAANLAPVLRVSADALMEL